MSGIKHDGGKSPLILIPYQPLAIIANAYPSHFSDLQGMSAFTLASRAEDEIRRWGEALNKDGLVSAACILITLLEQLAPLEQKSTRFYGTVPTESLVSPPYAALPTFPLLIIADVLAFGRKKYAQDNWRGGFEYTRVLSAALRHLRGWDKGEDIDSETKTIHIANTLCCLMFLLEMEHFGTGTDDRWKGYSLDKLQKKE